MRRKLGAGILALYLGVFIAAVSCFSFSILAEEDESGDASEDVVYTLGDFIDWMLLKDDLSDEQIEDLNLAKECYDEYVESGDIDPTDSNDAVAIDNVARSVHIMERIESLRKSDENYNGIIFEEEPTLSTCFEIMVLSSAATNQSLEYYLEAGELSHVSDAAYGWAYGEVLALGYLEPTDGWYDKEKALFDECRDELGYEAPLTKDQVSEIKSLANEKDYVVGHYTALFLLLDQMEGAGYSIGLSASHQDFMAQYQTSYAIEEFASYLCEYIVSIEPDECGEELSWSYDFDSRTLTVAGSGDMYDFESGEAPWYALQTFIESVDLESGVVSVGDYAFYSYGQLSSVSIPETLEEASQTSFESCDSLTDVEIADGIASVPDYLFYGCSGLVSVDIPDTVTSIGDYAFYGCSSLENIAMPDGVQSIGSHSFYSCESLSSVDLPDTVASIGDYAFYGCSSLESISLPENSIDVGEGILGYCKSLTQVTLPDGWTKISTFMFFCDSVLESVTIPSSVTSVAADAFCGCSSLEYIYYDGSQSDWTLNVNVVYGSSSVYEIYGDSYLSTAEFVFSSDEPLSSDDIDFYVNPNYDTSYTGSEITPTCVVVLRGSQYTSSYYDIEYTNNIEVGTATAVLTLKNGLEGTAETTFEITQCSLTSSNTVIEAADDEVSGVIVTTNGTVLEEGTDYTVTYTAVGSTVIVATVNGLGNYTAQVSEIFTVSSSSSSDDEQDEEDDGSDEEEEEESSESCDISFGELTLDEDSFTYSGSENEPEVAVCLNGASLTRDVDYTVAYSDNIDAGTAAVTVSGAGNYTGSLTEQFVIEAANISDTSIVLSEDLFNYTGEEIKPEIEQITYNGLELTAETDYTVSYEDNVSVGTGTVVITGQGNYTGTATRTFVIAVRAISEAEMEVVYDADTLEAELTLEYNGTVLTEDTDYTFSYTAYSTKLVYVSIYGIGNYGGSILKYLSYGDDELTVLNLTISIKSAEISGVYDTDAGAFTSIQVELDGVVLEEGADYTVSSVDDEWFVYGGFIYVTIEGIGTYYGELEEILGEDYGNLTLVSGSETSDDETEGGDSESDEGSGDSGKTSGDSSSEAEEDSSGDSQEDGSEDESDSGSEETGSNDSEESEGDDCSSGHVYDGGEILSEATCTEDGEILYTCTVCGETKTETISAVGHTASSPVIEDYVSPSCTTKGSCRSVVYCSVCGEEISSETVSVSATGHSYKAVVTAPTCTASGYTTYTCSVCGDSYKADYTAAAGHSYVSKTTKSATCTDDGIKTYTCSVCGDSYTETIDALGHAYAGSKTAATCTAKGYTTYTCSRCGDSYKDSYVSATGHSYSGNVCKTCGALKSSKISSSSVTLSSSSYTYDGSAKKPVPTVKVNGTVLKNGTDYTVSYSSNTAAGTATVMITGKGSYSGAKSITFTISKQTLSSSKTSLSYTSVTYSGKAKKPSVTVKNASGKTLKKGTDYTVTYSSNKAIGKATVTIKGIGNYSGTITKTFKIMPKKVTVSSAKSSSKKKLTVSWKKSSGKVYYQIAYKKKGSSTWSYKKVASTSAKSAVISGLSSGKYYYVKVRAYKKVNGKTYYGSWSSTKKVKVK